MRESEVPQTEGAAGHGWHCTHVLVALQTHPAASYTAQESRYSPSSHCSQAAQAGFSRKAAVFPRHGGSEYVPGSQTSQSLQVPGVFCCCVVCVAPQVRPLPSRYCPSAQLATA